MIRSKCRNMALAFVAPLAMWLPLNAWALGMGEIDVDSALNEQFRATIPLTDARDLQQTEIVVSLASGEDFERVGVERFHFLTSLVFEVDAGGREPMVRLTSNQPISEPYLNFIVEVMWPQGRLLKEFTVLLDPPTFTAVQSPSVEIAQEEPSERSISGETVGASGQVALNQSPSSSVTGPIRIQATQTGEILTTRDDTLWKIANRTRPERVDVNQQMLAIQDLNPRAFLRNNINLLKAGYRLTLPSEAQALSLSSREAQSEVSEQANAWQNRTSLARQQEGSDGDERLRSQVDATPEPAQDTIEVATEQGQVRIVAAGGDLIAGSSADATAETGRLLEENETLSRQVDELEYQLDREKELAQNQVELKSRELEVRDQELAALQSRLQELEKQVAQRQQNQATAPARELPIWQSPMVMGGVIGILILLLAYALLKGRREARDNGSNRDMQDRTGVDQPAAERKRSEDATPVEPYMVEEEPGNEEGPGNLEAPAAPASDNVVEFETSGPSRDEVVADLLEGLESEDASSDEASTTAAHEPDALGESDVIGEADIYIAYGRHGQAIGLLDAALGTEPNRHDVRLKLLEACVETQNSDQFAEHAEYLIANCDDEEILMACRELEARFNQAATALVDAPSVGSTGSSLGPETPETDNSAADMEGGSGAESALTGEETIFSIDDLDEAPDEVLKHDEGVSTEALDEDLEDGEFELEFDTLDEQETETQAETEDSDAAPKAADDLDFSELEALEAAEDGRNSAAEMSSENDGIEPSPLDEDMGDFDFGAEGETDINATKIDLAEAYIDMGDGDGARDILNEVLEEGSPEQKSRAQELLDGIN